MYQPLASNFEKKPFLRISRNVWFNLKAKWWIWSGQTEQSIEYWRYRLKIDSQHLKVQAAKKLINFQTFDEVLVFLESIPEEELNSEILGLLGKCYLGKGQHNQALSVIQKALKHSLDSDLLELHSDCLLELGRWEEAIKSLERALRISPNRSETIYRLGSIYLYHREFSEALQCFQGCCNVDSRNPLYWEMKAETHLELGQFSEAVQSFEKALRLGINPDTHARIAYCYIQLKEIKKGIKHYQKVLKYEPDHYDALCNLGAVYQNLERPLEAIKLFEHAQEINANDPILLNNLAYTLVHLGRSRKAGEIYKKALELSNNNPTILYNLSVCYADKGSWEEAQRTLSCLLDVEPHHSEGWILLGNIYEQLSKYEEAVDCFNYALKLA